MGNKAKGNETFGSQVCVMCNRPIDWYTVINGVEDENTIKGLEGDSVKAESVVTEKYSNGKGNTMYKLEITAQCKYCNAKNKFDYHIDR